MLAFSFLPTYFSASLALGPAIIAPPTTFDTARGAAYATGTKHTVSTQAGLLAAAAAAYPDNDSIAIALGTTITMTSVTAFASRSTSGGVVEIRPDISDAVLAAVCPEGTRMTPTRAAALNLPKIAFNVAPTSPVGITFAHGATGYRFTAIEFLQDAASAAMGDMVRMGNPDLKTASEFTSRIGFDRCYLHGSTTVDCGRAISMNGTFHYVVDSWLEDFYKAGDSQAINIYGSKGPFRVHNNYLDGYGENFMVGGSENFSYTTLTAGINAAVTSLTVADAGANSYGGPYPTVPFTASLYNATDFPLAGLGDPNREQVTVTAINTSTGVWTITRGVNGTSAATHNTGGKTYGVIAGLLDANGYMSTDAIPQDIEFTNNFLTAKFAQYNAGDPSHSQRKNLFELKCGVRVLCAYNVLEHTWDAAQPGEAILLKNTASVEQYPAKTTRDVNVTGNWIRSVAGGLRTQQNGPGVPATVPAMSYVWVHENLFELINTAPYINTSVGYCAVMSGADHFWLEHNTFVKWVNTAVPGLSIDNYDVTDSFACRSNILQLGPFGVKKSGIGEGSASLASAFPGYYDFLNNAMVGDAALHGATYPATTTGVAADANVGFTDLAGGGVGYLLAVSSPFKNAGHDGADVGISNVTAFFANLAGVDGSGGASPSTAWFWRRRRRQRWN